MNINYNESPRASLESHIWTISSNIISNQNMAACEEPAVLLKSD